MLCFSTRPSIHPWPRRLCLLLLLWAAPAHAYFLDAANGARPAGMGDAFVGLADDSNALLFNPAGLATLTENELSGMYADLFTNLNPMLYTGRSGALGYNCMSSAVPLGPVWGTLGAGWLHFNSVLYQENTWMLAYAHSLLPPDLFEFPLSLDAGLTWKGLQWEVTPGDYSGKEWKMGWTADTGILLRAFNLLQLGVTCENTIPVNMNVDGPGEPLPRLWRLGLAYQIHWLHRTMVLSEFDYRNQVWTYKFGLESWANEALALRMGATNDTFTCGFSYAVRHITNTPFSTQLDYAFSFPFWVQDTLGSHRLGLVFLWDPTYLEKERKKQEAQIQAHALEEKVRNERLLVLLQQAQVLAQASADTVEQTIVLQQTLATLPSSGSIKNLQLMTEQGSMHLYTIANSGVQAAENAQRAAQVHLGTIQAQRELSPELRLAAENEVRRIGDEVIRATQAKTQLNSPSRNNAFPTPTQPLSLFPYVPWEIANREIQQQVTLTAQAITSVQNALDSLRSGCKILNESVTYTFRNVNDPGLADELKPLIQISEPLSVLTRSLDTLGLTGLASLQSQYHELQALASMARQAKSFPVNTRDTITIGYEREQLSDLDSPTKMLTWIEHLSQYLSARMRIKINYTAYPDSASLLHDLRLGELDVVVVPARTAETLALGYIAAPLQTVKISGQTSQPNGVFVRANDRFQKWSDLQKRTLGYVSDEGLRNFEVALSSECPNLPIDKFFHSKKHFNSNFAAIMALQINAVDVVIGPRYLLTITDKNKNAFTQTLTELSGPKLGSTPHPVLMTRTLLVRNKWKKISTLAAELEALKDTPAGRAFLDPIRVERVVFWHPDEATTTEHE